jgi:hypothetical protein
MVLHLWRDERASQNIRRIVLSPQSGHRITEDAPGECTKP